MRIPRPPYHDNACGCVGNLAFHRKRQRALDYALSRTGARTFFKNMHMQSSFFAFWPEGVKKRLDGIERNLEIVHSAQICGFFKYSFLVFRAIFGKAMENQGDPLGFQHKNIIRLTDGSRRKN